MWERFSYYGMRAFLVLFLVSSAGGFGWTKEEASRLYGLYGWAVYMTPLLGGYLADRVLGTHRALIVGGTLISAGHFCLALPGKMTFFFGLGLIVLGTGFFKSNISTMVGQLYRERDPRRDAGFTIFYMGINMGAFLGPIVCSYLAESSRFGWHYGFASAGVGMVFGVGTYLAFRSRYLAGIGAPPAPRPKAAAPGAKLERLSSEEKQRIGAVAALAVFNVFFWMAFEQAGSSMNFFAAERTNRMLFGWDIPAGWFQAINAVSIIVFAPMFAALWLRLGQRGREPSTPNKFLLALLLVASGFVVMVIAARLSDGGAKVSPLWLCAAYVLHTWGELCLSPVGLSMVTKLAPARHASLLMGCWWFSFSFAELAAGLLASVVEKVEKGQVFHLLGGQADFFLIFVIAPCAAAGVLFFLARPINKLMHGKA